MKTVTELTSDTLRKVFVFGIILVCIQSECGKIRTKITPNTNTFYASDNYPEKMDEGAIIRKLIDL